MRQCDYESLHSRQTTLYKPKKENHEYCYLIQIQNVKLCIATSQILQMCLFKNCLGGRPDLQSVQRTCVVCQAKHAKCKNTKYFSYGVNNLKFTRTVKIRKVVTNEMAHAAKDYQSHVNVVHTRGMSVSSSSGNSITPSIPNIEY